MAALIDWWLASIWSLFHAAVPVSTQVFLIYSRSNQVHLTNPISGCENKPKSRYYCLSVDMADVIIYCTATAAKEESNLYSKVIWYIFSALSLLQAFWIFLEDFLSQAPKKDGLQQFKVLIQIGFWKRQKLGHDVDLKTIFEFRKEVCSAKGVSVNITAGKMALFSYWK